jgi:hypothetical protein
MMAGCAAEKCIIYGASCNNSCVSTDCVLIIPSIIDVELRTDFITNI